MAAEKAERLVGEPLTAAAKEKMIRLEAENKKLFDAVTGVAPVWVYVLTISPSFPYTAN